jgi:uncharacterized protein YnzC (UPF0291/DUF896 family)
LSKGSSALSKEGKVENNAREREKPKKNIFWDFTPKKIQTPQKKRENDFQIRNETAGNSDSERDAPLLRRPFLSWERGGVPNDKATVAKLEPESQSNEREECVASERHSFHSQIAASKVIQSGNSEINSAYAPRALWIRGSKQHFDDPSPSGR